MKNNNHINISLIDNNLSMIANKLNFEIPVKDSKQIVPYSKNMDDLISKLIEFNTNFKIYFFQIFERLKLNKKKILLIIICLGFIYFIYRKFLAPRIKNIILKLMKKILEYHFSNNSPINSLYNNNNENYLNNFYIKTLQKCLSFHKEKLNKFTSIYELYQNLSKENARKEQLTPMWIIFKFKTFVYFFSCIYSIRFSLILKQIHALILEKICLSENGNYIKIPFEIQKEIIEANEIILNDFCENFIFKRIENMIKPICDNILINSSFSYDEFIIVIKNCRIKIEEILLNKSNKEFYFKLFSDYQNFISEKICLYENNEFQIILNNKNEKLNNNIIKVLENNQKNNRFLLEANFKFYSILFDVFNSNIFNAILINCFDYDYSIIYESLKLNFNAIVQKDIKFAVGSIPVAKILSFTMNIFEKILDEKNSIYNIKEFNGKKLNDEINSIYRYIFD
jgi:hypothetical protein